MRPSTPPPLTEQADDVEAVWTLFLSIAAGVGLLVIGLIAWSVLRHRRRDDAGGTLPSQVHYNIPVEVAYTVVPLLIVAGLFVVTFVSVRAVDQDDVDADLTVDVTAFQWQWQFDYPESGVSTTGVGTDYPELVLPAERTVRFNLTSPDVIHSFWVPGFRYKREIFPDEVSSFTVDVGDRTGVWENTGVCGEFCGLDHHKMRFTVRVLAADEFDRWVGEQQAGAAAVGRGS